MNNGQARAWLLVAMSSAQSSEVSSKSVASRSRSFKEKGLLRAISNSKVTSAKAVDSQRVCHLFEFNIFYCVDLKPVLEKQKVVDNRIQSLRSLGDEFVVTKPVGLTKDLLFSFAKNERRKALKVYIKAGWQSI